MSLVRALGRALHLAVTPVFLAMAFVTFGLEAQGFGHAGHAVRGHVGAWPDAAYCAPAVTPTAICPAPSAAEPEVAAAARIGVGQASIAVPAAVAVALPSMWLMYLLMALAHAPAWLPAAAVRDGGRP